MKKRILYLVSLLLVILLISGCAGSTKNSSPGTSSDDFYDRGGVENEAPAPAEMPEKGESLAPGEADFGSSTDGSNKVADLMSQMGSKIIKSGYMALETLEFEETTSSLSRMVQQAGGFIASSNIQGWSKNDAKNKPLRQASYKLRIPSDRFEQFMTDMGELGNITRNENWGEDVSSQYFDTEARLQSLTIQEERLLTILSKAEVLTDIIELERELSTVRYEIENLTGTLRKYDNLIAYSTLEISVQEVEEITEIVAKPVTLWEKIAKSFQDSIKSATEVAEGLLLFLVGAIPFLLLLGILLLILLGIARLLSRKSRKQAHSLPIANNNQKPNDEKKE